MLFVTTSDDANVVFCFSTRQSNVPDYYDALSVSQQTLTESPRRPKTYATSDNGGATDSKNKLSSVSSPGSRLLCRHAIQDQIDV